MLADAPSIVLLAAKLQQQHLLLLHACLGGAGFTKALPAFCHWAAVPVGQAFALSLAKHIHHVACTVSPADQSVTVSLHATR